VQVIVDKTTRLDFLLEVQALEVEDVIVTAYQQTKVEKDLTATKQIYNIAEVQSIAGVQDISDILELQADVVDNHFRGGRVGESSYLLGGATIVNPLDNSRAFNPIVTGLDQVEVYTSGFSAEYGNAQSGVVNMVTKEGSGTWQTRVEFSGTLPYYKSWNGSVYSPSNLLFVDSLMKTAEWLKENPLLPGRPLWDRGYGVTKYLPQRVVWPPDPLTREDSLRIAEFGRILWLQSVRDLGMEYDNTVDYRVDLTTGGPVAKDARIFLAARQNLVNPIVPTTQPDLERQLMSNLTYSPTVKDKLKLSFIYDYSFSNFIGSNWERWMFDRTFSITKRTQKSWHYGLEWKHVFNPANFADLNFSVLNVKEEDRLDLLREDQYLNDYTNNRNWVDYTGPSNHRVGRLNDDRGDRKTETYYLNGNFTSQIDRFNLLKTGVQFYYYDIFVDYQNNVTNESTVENQVFAAYPFEGAIYFQDKMEYEGFIANLGMRFDFYDLNTTYFTNKFYPLLDPEAKSETKLYTRLQPRIGFSFPVSEATVFHLNYGTFTQRPNFNQLFFNEVNISDNVVRVLSLGNPELRPENTKSYDVGIVHLLEPGVQLDVSAYYKDVKDLIQTAFYKNISGEAYATYINLDYADIKGFHLSLEKNIGLIRGYVRYNFESSTGKSSNPDNLNVAPIFSEDQNLEDEGLSERFPEDVYLDYDRTHKAVFNLRFLSPPNFGFEVFGFKPLAKLSVSSTYRFYTGRPYTWDESGQGLKFNQRTPTENDLRLRIEKTFKLGLTGITGYFEVFNLLNEQFWHYSRTFNNDRNVVRWETLENREDILIEDLYTPYDTRQDVYLLRNEPRHYRLGLILKF
jgi:outer membrane receptor protein involved in Fe transport